MGAMMKVEICVDSVEGALAAVRGGADRIELCDNLFEGGTTPSFGMIRVVRSHVAIGLHVLIRPRGGDFLYSDDEIEVMHEDLRQCKSLGVDGVVTGCLTADGDVDRERMRLLIAESAGLSFTFHRAFDMCRNPIEALEHLIDLGVHRVLTSGQANSALEGAELISKLRAQAGDRIIIMAGGGITPQNVGSLVSVAGVAEIHLSARTMIESSMRFRNSRCRMASSAPVSEFQRRVTDEAIVRAVRAQLPP